MSESKRKIVRSISAHRVRRLRSSRAVELRRPQTIPLEYGGQWIAWDENMRRIIAHADTLSEVREQVAACNAVGARYQKVPTSAQIRAHGKG